MLFVVEIFGKPDFGGIADVIEHRVHTAVSVTDAVRTAQANLRSLPPPAFGFSLKSDGKELGRWQIARDGDGGNGLSETALADEGSSTPYSRRLIAR